MILGSGYRSTVEQLLPPDRERMREENLGIIRRASVRLLEANVVYVAGLKQQLAAPARQHLPSNHSK
jgi:hypothetical protein